MIKDTIFRDMALIDKVRVIKLLLFALFMMVSMVTPAQSQVDWSIKAGIGMANIIGDNMGSPKVKLAYKLGIGLECPLIRSGLYKQVFRLFPKALIIRLLKQMEFRLRLK